MVEKLIYGYLAICAAMIVFNVACILVFRDQDRKLSGRSEAFEQEVLRQFRAGSMTKREEQQLLRKLRNVSNLMAFDQALSRLYAEEPEQARRYVQSLSPAFMSLTMDYVERNDLQAAYFPYLIHRYEIFRGEKSRVLAELMLKLLSAESLYCRENALEALYTIGNADSVLTALRILDRSDSFHHPKLLSDGLLEFAGDREALNARLWENFSGFSEQMQVTLLNYFRFQSGEHWHRVLELLGNDETPDEVRYSCIRYFGKYPHEEARPWLFRFGQYGIERWEYTTITAAALASYPGEDTVELLKKLVCSRSWYTRYNAAESLEKLRVPYEELYAHLRATDRYAADMLQYQRERKQLGEREALPV